MGWEQRRGRSYYYRKVRVRGRVRSKYVGSGIVAQLCAGDDEDKRRDRLAMRAADHATRQGETEIVRVINLSVGDPNQPFDRAASPWAKLLDWLSWKYNVLFVVSAGNHAADIVLDLPRNQFSSLNPEQLQTQTISAIAREIRHRRLLSPAEAVNALTVGAQHSDRSGSPNPPHRVDPFQHQTLPSPVTALGNGFRGAVKPEILFSGGRQIFSEKLGTTHPNATLQAALHAAGPGHKVASPSPIPGDTNAVRHVCGTSNAAALATRSAAKLCAAIEQLSAQPNGDTLDDEFISVLLKTLLVHSARWGQPREILEEVLRNGADLRRFKKQVSRFLGYGAADVNRMLACTETRATIIGCGMIQVDDAHQFSVPLPPSLSAQKVFRRLTTTLAWFSPINPRHRNYRVAALWLEPPKDELRVQRINCDHHSVQKGTVQHEVLEGEAATAFTDGDRLHFRINCRADAGQLSEPVRYGLAVSLEVADGISIPIYDEVRVRLLSPVSISPAS
jgi:hypothetical protein